MLAFTLGDYTFNLVAKSIVGYDSHSESCIIW